ncbi:MAG TPA: molybdopterin-dependent oxidoreductase [Ktedonobacterales bacterium]
MDRLAPRSVAGLAAIAGSLSVIAALIIRYVFAVPMPAELFGDQATTRIPLPLFEALLTTFGPLAKHLYLVGALVAEAALTAAAGLGYVGIRRLFIRRAGLPANPQVLAWVEAPIVAIGLWLLSALILSPLVGGGIFEIGMLGGPTGALLSQVTPYAVFALAFVWQARAQSGPDSAAQSNSGREPIVTRRMLLRQSVAAVGLIGVGIGLWEALTNGFGAAFGAGPSQNARPTLALGAIPERITPPPTPVYEAWTEIAGQTSEVTTAANFYYVSKNLAADPSLAAAAWTLNITGMVDRPYPLTLDQLQHLPGVSQYHTLECISNEVGGNLMSNGLFVGAQLASVLNLAGIQPGATQVTFVAADGYSDSLHLAQALDERSLIAYRLDGAPLPQPHGFPARLLIPGLYGMKNGKWLTELRVGSGDYAGYWEQRGWTSVAAVKLMSRIDTPHDGDLLVAAPSSIAGVAYSGAQGIARVDVSVDAGRTWSAANMRRPLGALTWTLWEYPWLPTPGEHIIVARAIDLEGRVQSPLVAPPLPDGSSGYHAITVTVR